METSWDNFYFDNGAMIDKKNKYWNTILLEVFLQITILLMFVHLKLQVYSGWVVVSLKHL